MAKRRRLSLEGGLPQSGLEQKSLAPSPGTPAPAASPGFPPAPPPAHARAAPISQIAGDASAQAALAALTQELEAARLSGRLIMQIPLERIDTDYLQRDRMDASVEGMADLIASLRDRGQQTPIEVAALEQGRYGLISGWRRLAALRHLHELTGEARFGHVLALLRAPESAAQAYRAMIEENEIRAGISYFERARIAALAAGAGVYPDARAAIAGLFAAASRAKRSKIGSFLRLHEALEGRLRFGPAIPERLGLALARAIEADADFPRRLRDRLRKAEADSAEAELALLEKALRNPASPDMTAAPDTPDTPDTSASPAGASTHPDPAPPDTAPARPPHVEEVRPGVWLETTGGFSRATLTLSGDKVDGPLRARLIDWLKTQG